MKLPKIHIVKKSKKPGEEVTDGGFDAWNILVPSIYRSPWVRRGVWELEFGIYKINPDYNPWMVGGDPKKLSAGFMFWCEIRVPVINISWPKKIIRVQVINSKKS